MIWVFLFIVSYLWLSAIAAVMLVFWLDAFVAWLFKENKGPNQPNSQ